MTRGRLIVPNLPPTASSTTIAIAAHSARVNERRLPDVYRRWSEGPSLVGTCRCPIANEAALRVAVRGLGQRLRKLLSVHANLDEHEWPSLGLCGHSLQIHESQSAICRRPSICRWGLPSEVITCPDRYIAHGRKNLGAVAGQTRAFDIFIGERCCRNTCLFWSKNIARRRLPL